MSQRSISNGYSRLSDLPAGSVVGTSSLRRIAQLTRLHPGLVFQDVRGNLNTRMKKLDGEWDAACPEYTALILAESGMSRMGQSWIERITRSIPSEGEGGREESSCKMFQFRLIQNALHYVYLLEGSAGQQKGAEGGQR